MEIYGDDDDTTDIQDQQEMKANPFVGYTAHWLKIYPLNQTLTCINFGLKR